MIIKKKIYELSQLVKFDLFTVDNLFVLQLFDKSVNPNDVGVSCIWENDHFDVEKLLDEAIKWSKERYR